MTWHPLRSKTAIPWLIALCGVVGGTVPAPQLLAQRAADQGGIDTVKVRENVYAFFGAGGNVTAHIGEDGVILVDAGAEAQADRLIAAIKAVTPLPIRLIVNTSADPNHVGGNEKVALTGTRLNPDSFSEQEQATVLSHEAVLNRMSTPNAAGETPFPTGSWPTETFTSRYRSLYVNNEAVQVIRQLNAVTDGDVMVHFRRADVIATGNIIDLRQFPVIDAAVGGSIQGELEALNRLIDLTVPAMPLVYKEGRTLLVPGYGRVSDYSELVEYRDMVTTVRDNIQDLMKKGMSLEQVKAANPTAGYRGRYGSDTGSWTTDKFVEAIYNGLSGRTGKS